MDSKALPGDGPTPARYAKNEVDEKVEDFLAKLKSKDRLRTARLLFGPFLRIINKLSFFTKDSATRVLKWDDLVKLIQRKKSLTRKETLFLIGTADVLFQSRHTFLMYSEFDNFRFNLEYSPFFAALNNLDFFANQDAGHAHFKGPRMSYGFFDVNSKRRKFIVDSEAMSRLDRFEAEARLASVVIYESILAAYAQLGRKISSSGGLLSNFEKGEISDREIAQAMADEFFDFFLAAQQAKNEPGQANWTIWKILTDSDPQKPQDLGLLDKSQDGIRSRIEEVILHFVYLCNYRFKDLLARFYYGPYRQILSELVDSDPMPSNWYTIRELLDMSRKSNRLSQSQQNFLVAFAKVFFDDGGNAYFPHFSDFFKHYSAYYRGTFLRTTGSLVFESCARKSNLPDHNVASFFYIDEYNGGTMCFDVDKLQALHPDDYEIQIASLFVHELTHAVFEVKSQNLFGSKRKDHDYKQFFDDQGEYYARVLQQEFFKFYSDHEDSKDGRANFNAHLGRFLNDLNEVCKEDGELEKVFANIQVLSRVLESYYFSISDFLRGNPVPIELLDLKEFLERKDSFRIPLRGFNFEGFKSNSCIGHQKTQWFKELSDRLLSIARTLDGAS